jgi:hypothetical protein
VKGTPSIAVLVLAAILIAAAAAWADEGPTREEYVAAIDPICKTNVDANKKVLDGVGAIVKAGKLKVAATKFTTVAANFGKTIKTIEKIPRPPVDSPRLEKWFKFLKIVQENLAKVGKALREENKIRASHEKIRAERSSNAANNVSFVFGFHYCNLKPGQFK